MSDVTQAQDTPGAIAQDTPAGITLQDAGTNLGDILSDLTQTPNPNAAKPSEAPAAKPGDTTPKPGDEPLADDDPNTIKTRNDYLKKVGAINTQKAELEQRSKDLDAREKALAAGTPKPGEEAKPKPFELKLASDEYTWEDPPAKALVADLKTVAELAKTQHETITAQANELAELKSQLGLVNQSQTQAVATAIMGQLESAVPRIKADYGIDLTIEDLAASTDKMGKALLGGSQVLPNDLVIKCWLSDPDNHEAIQAAIKAGAEKPVDQGGAGNPAVIPPLRTGGAHATDTGKAKTVEHQILEDLGKTA